MFIISTWYVLIFAHSHKILNNLPKLAQSLCARGICVKYKNLKLLVQKKNRKLSVRQIVVQFCGFYLSLLSNEKTLHTINLCFRPFVFVLKGNFFEHNPNSPWLQNCGRRKGIYLSILFLSIIKQYRKLIQIVSLPL